MAENDTDQLAEMRKRYSRARDHWAPIYDQALEDIRFIAVPGHQWDAKLKARRGDRACYEFPKLKGHVRQVVNEMRQNRPGGKVRGVEESDQALAEIMQGMCRNIESMSNADQAYDIAFEQGVQGGIGYWRMTTDYASQDDFDLDIFIKPIRNFVAVKFDPAAVEIDRSDANWCFVEELISKDDFERRYPKADLSDFDTDHECRDWWENGQVRVAEYWYKEPVKRTLLALSSGDTVFEDEVKPEELKAAGITILKTRDVDDKKVYMRLANGREFLTKPYEFPSKYIPIVPCWGEIENIDGEDHIQGMVRPSKDQQRLHNVHRTAAIEAVAKAPKAPFLLKLKWIKGLEHFWNKANAEDYPYLPVNDQAEQMPQRATQAEVPAALIQLAALDNDDLKAATGIYDASLGARSNETSGIAIGQRKQQGATATFHYIDNLGYAIRQTYRILIDMIPRVYDTPRVVRILGEDGGAKWKQLYHEVQDPETGQPVVLNDISKGKYDVVVTVGPSFATQRMESVAAYAEMAGQVGAQFPPLAAILAYQVVKNTDLPGSEDVEKALRRVLVGQGLLEPQEGDQPPQPPPPDPRVQAQVQKLLADADKSKAQGAKAAAEASVIQPRAASEIYKNEADANSQHMDNMERIHIAHMLQMPMPMQPEQPAQGDLAAPVSPLQPG
jgi:hypothetical protein